MTAEFASAVHALVYLAHTARVTPSAELAGNICTNPARVRKIMAKLCRAGLAQAGEGRASGYHCIPDSEGISLKAVAEALGEKPVSVGWRSGDADRDCRICAGMAGVMDGVYGELNAVCLDKLSTITIGTISEKIFLGSGDTNDETV